MKPLTLDLSLRSSEVLDLINEIEARYPVGEWKVNGVRIWPLLRVRLYTDIFGAALLDGHVPTSRQRTRERLMRVLRTAARYLKVRWADRAKHARWPEEVDVIFLSDGVSFSDIEGRWYERFFDPMMEVLRRDDRTALLLTPMTMMHQPRWSPSRLIQPGIDAVKVRSALPPRRAVDCEFEGLEAMLDQLRAIGLSALVPSVTEVTEISRRLLLLERHFARMLNRVKARRAFVNTYYSAEGMAFTLAARRRGILVADFQHGVQGENHVAYGRWSRVPEGGYDLLPQEFWVWSETELRAIEAWSPAGGSGHLAVHCGNPWLDLWGSGELPALRASTNAARAARDADPRKHVLVSLQWGIADAECRKMLAAAELCKDMAWWFRMHPLMLREIDAFRRLIGEYDIPGCQIELPTNLPLPAILGVVDAHVTASSTVVIEASHFGVPSVITSQFGAQCFEAQIASGIAELAEKPEMIAQALRRMRDRMEPELTGLNRLRAALHSAFTRGG